MNLHPFATSIDELLAGPIVAFISLSVVYAYVSGLIQAFGG